MSKITIIDLVQPSAQCCICGEWDHNRWGIPISLETALVISNDSDEDWAGKPACQSCWTKHDNGELVGVDPNF